MTGFSEPGILLDDACQMNKDLLETLRKKYKKYGIVPGAKKRISVPQITRELV